MGFKKSKPEATRLARVASGLSTGQLRDSMLMYVNSAAVAVNAVVTNGINVGLETAIDNCECIIIIAKELQERNPEEVIIPPNEHLQSLVEKYFAKKGVVEK
jgi:hypothetical protein